MKFQLYPGYEFLNRISMDLAGDKDSEDTEFQEQLKQVHSYTIPEDTLVEDITIPGTEEGETLDCRFYRPKTDEKVPLLLMIHGGGFVTGSYAMDNNRATRYARKANIGVISVNYRLAPKYQYPCALLDCLTTLKWCCENHEKLNILPDKLAVYGSSAGGTLAAALCLYIRDYGGPKISFQILSYPCLSYTSWTNVSARQNQDAPVLPGRTLGTGTCSELYYGNPKGEPISYYAFPTECTNLCGLPPAAVICSEFDPLRDEGLDYGRKLQSFGVPTEIYSLPRVPHGYDMIKDGALTTWVQDGISLSLRREFGTL